MPGIFVTGTGTDVGKTIIASGIAFYLKKNGTNVGVMKPFATAEKRHSRKYASSDVAKLADAVDSRDSDHEMNPYFYPVPASPLVASALCGKPAPSLHVALTKARRLMEKHSVLVVEGIGGILVPLTRKHTVGTFASLLGLPAIIVTTPFLGTLSNTLLTVQACSHLKIHVAGIVVNMMPSHPDRVTGQSPIVIRDLCRGIPVITVRKLGDFAPNAVAESLQRAGIANLLSAE